MKLIEIDLDIHRHLEAARLDFDETPNTILRRLLEIDKPEALTDLQPPLPRYIKANLRISEPENKTDLRDAISRYQSNLLQSRLAASAAVVQTDWIYGGARLPEGTKLQKWMGKQKLEAVIHNGSIFINGEFHQSPSSAAMAVNGGTNVNGWNFWEYYDEDKKQWFKIGHLRK